MCADVADACDVLLPVYEATDGRDGRVSIEVSPELSRDTDGTVAQAKQLWAQVDRPNAMIKIPATVEGLEAISQVIGAGISVNVTLIFSLTRYRQVINAYLVGLERARQSGLDLAGIHSVASFFVSRVDSLVDSKLDEIGGDTAAGLRSRAGLANARLAYEVFEQGFESERAATLAAAGANPQRPLWASTGVKDPSLPDTLYVTELVAPMAVNTMPEATLNAFIDHGAVTGDTISSAYRDSDALLNELDGVGIDYTEITDRLETEGLEKFEASWSQLLTTVAAELDAAR
jgi:transaldolase